ncbi:LysE family translocator [Antarctobacter heliothermus]|uniref:Threonine/homoserine/homoserine lactone efflux protein n=1 Tax=Antarctobacter heliothermus TaxID=74033 RepID=A0A239G6P6_9RHOB|nr:LysE family translocator [Antarctobacter heliothermus]SNS64123.1 Threonine/homoserine/homoserine lactone efflux protein [Antarctobacter heliothermus]
MSVEAYLIYLAALAAFFATPPDTSQLLIMSNSLRHGLRRSLWTVAGDLSANIVQMTAAGFGLVAVIAASASVLVWVKWAGVAYLVWIGLSLILRAPATDRPGAAPLARRRVLFRQGFLTSAANPYAVVFFGALFPQFIDPTTAVIPQLVLLGGTYLLVDGVILILWGYAASRVLSGPLRLSGRMLNRVSGGLMIAAALLLGSRDLAQEAEL